MASKFGNWFGLQLYKFMLACNQGDYVCEDADGKPTIVPSEQWIAKISKEGISR